MKLRNLILTGLALGLLGAVPAHATIIGFSAALSSAGAPAAKIAPPPVVLNSLVFNTGQQGFDEQQNVLLAAPLAVDSGSIAAGIRVNSHMIFLNKQDGVSGTLSHRVTWTFDGRILGVMSKTDGSLEFASSALLGAPATTYPGPPFPNRGLEGADFYNIINGNQLDLNMVVTQPGDWVRVVTAVPEPGTMTLMGLGIAALLGYNRRRRS